MNVQNQITSITNNTTVAQQAAYEPTSELDQDSFLQLLMSQLKNQDPLNPMDSKQFMSQQAQLTQVTETQELNDNMSNMNNMLFAQNQISQASNMIGKEVTITDPENEGNTITGVVSEAKFNSNDAKIVVDDAEYSLTSIQSVR